MGFFARFRTNRQIRKSGMIPIGDLSDEDIKCELALVVKDAGLIAATIGTVVSTHYGKLDEDTIEESLEDALYFIEQLQRVTDKAGNKHYTMSYIYALLYHLYATNNGLMLDPVWSEAVQGIQSTLGIRMTEKKCGSSTDGYA